MSDIVCSFVYDFSTENKHVLLNVVQLIRLCQKELKKYNVFIDLWKESEPYINTMGDSLELYITQSYDSHRYDIIISIQIKVLCKKDGKPRKTRIDRRNLHFVLNCTKTKI